MARNVTQKDQTLNEIIDWCEQLAAEGLRLASALLMQHDMDAYGVVRGQVNAYEKTADHCRSMLGYTGNMPTEVPNQSEDTKRRLTNCMITAVTSSTRTMCMACLTSGVKATSSRSALSCSSAMRD